MNRKKRKHSTPNKGFKSKSDTILLIVENSEARFFNSYFKNYLKETESVSIHCISSGMAGKCEIANGNKMSKKIKSSLETDGYKAVFIMIDLDSKFYNSEQNHNCLVKLKREYLPKYDIPKELKDRFYLFVVCNEIESWFLTIDEAKNNTNNPNEDHKKALKKLLNVRNEKEIVEKMISQLRDKKVELDFSKNTSLQHFITKLQEFNNTITL